MEKKLKPWWCRRNVRNDTIEECVDELLLLQEHYTQEEINSEERALFWTRGVHRSIEIISALKEE